MKVAILLSILAIAYAGEVDDSVKTVAVPTNAVDKSVQYVFGSLPFSPTVYSSGVPSGQQAVPTFTFNQPMTYSSQQFVKTVEAKKTPVTFKSAPSTFSLFAPSAPMTYSRHHAFAAPLTFKNVPTSYSAPTFSAVSSSGVPVAYSGKTAVKSFSATAHPQAYSVPSHVSWTAKSAPTAPVAYSAPVSHVSWSAPAPAAAVAYTAPVAPLTYSAPSTPVFYTAGVVPKTFAQASPQGPTHITY